MQGDIAIRKIRNTDPLWDQVYRLREAVLRVPLGLSLANEDLGGDAEDDVFIALEAGKVVGCLMRKPQAGGVAKLRQMAVDPALQGKGIGRLLMLAAEADAREQGFTAISLHARKNVAAFYTTLGYQVQGGEFEEVTIPHLLMQKDL